MTLEKTAVIILAAGKGSRMKSSLPKVLHKVCGKAMISHVIDASVSLNPEKIITVLSPNMANVEAVAKNKSQIAIQKQALGTADAIKPALELLQDFKGNILILYADTPLIEQSTLENMLTKLNESDVATLAFRPNDPAEYGRLIVNDSGDLESIIEYKDASQSQRNINLCNSGVIAAKSDILQTLTPQINNNNAKGEYYLTDIIELARANKNKCGFIEASEDEVLGVNNRVQLSEAESILQNRLRKLALLEGATLIDPKTTYLCHDTKLGKDVIIEPNVTFGANVCIKDNVTIKSFSHIEDATIEENCSIGPFARIRPKSKIGKNVKIGNFVEVKKSNINEAAKIGHLAYIGDSEIGEEVNIGAGVITCNYDGKDKHKTQIGKASFIGSNSSLVAPVDIGENSFIGAGSTITKNVSSGSLSVARGKQITKENWTKKD